MTDRPDGETSKFSDYLRRARDFAQDQANWLADQWQLHQQPPMPPYPGGGYPPYPVGQYPQYPGADGYPPQPGAYPAYPPNPMGGAYTPNPMGGAYPPNPVGDAYQPNPAGYPPHAGRDEPQPNIGMTPFPQGPLEGSQPAKPVDPTDTAGWITYTVLDRQFQIPARIIRMPQGWHAEGQVVWNTAERDSPVKIASIVRSPDGSAFVDIPARFDFLANVGAPWQPTGTGRICMPHDSVANLVLNYIAPALVPQAQATAVNPVHDVQQRWGIDLTANLRLGVRFDACEITLDYRDERGQDWTELWRCLGALNPPTSPFIQHQLVLYRFGSHREKHTEVLPILTAIAKSTQETVQWSQLVGQMNGQISQQMDTELASFNQQAWQNIQANQARSAQLMSGMVQSHIQRQQESWSRPSAQAAFGNALAGQVEVPDPNSSYGNTQYASSSSGYVWQNQNGDLIETDDPNFDPRPNSHDTWNVVRRYGE